MRGATGVRFLAWAGLGWSLVGCGQYSLLVDRRVPREHVAGFEEGGTRVSEVLSRLGPPSQISALPEGFAMLYEHLEIHEDQAFLQFGLVGDTVFFGGVRDPWVVDLFEWLEYLKAGGAVGGVRHEALLLLFDRRRRLIGMRHSDDDKDLGFGLVFAPSFDSARVFNVNEQREKAPQLSWGMRLLRPLPDLLNASRDLDSGASGLERRDTPSGVGQQMVVPEPSERR
jgi:hypothetical protein